jgi:hypothetical protein
MSDADLQQYLHIDFATTTSSRQQQTTINDRLSPPMITSNGDGAVSAFGPNWTSDDLMSLLRGDS